MSYDARLRTPGAREIAPDAAPPEGHEFHGSGRRSVLMGILGRGVLAAPVVAEAQPALEQFRGAVQAGLRAVPETVPFWPWPDTLASAARSRCASACKSFQAMAPLRSTSGRNSQNVSP